MALQCRFNNPTDEINEEEYTMYVYAMLLWRLQDGMGLSFEKACAYIASYRTSAIDRLIEYRTDIDLNDYKKIREFENKLYPNFEWSKEAARISKWIRDNCKRFKMPVDMRNIDCDVNIPDPEFSYHDWGQK